MKEFFAMKSPRSAVVAAVAVIALVLFGGYLLESDGDQLFKINKSIDVFGRVYKEIAVNYVDEVDPEKFMQAGIEGMLETLDPYTVYIPRDESDEIDQLTTGKYGGIGVTIGMRDGAVGVISVLDGYSAQRQGIMPGDILIEVDGAKVDLKKLDDVRNMMRGDPGTEVHLKVRREGEGKPLEFTLIREEIQMKNVTYADLLSNHIGYIRLERFSRRAGDEVRQAIKDLQARGPLKGLVLDLRGNPGGLLDAAVDVASKFVPRGSLIVSTRGRHPENYKKYLSEEEPLLPNTPLIVLTNRGTASASEIVSGSLQDLDRAVVVGDRTFGKGLVQTIVPLTYGAQLKLTTARYFTPSGRSIQEIDYTQRRKGGMSVVVDSLNRKSFLTVNGRSVLEHGGIAPDSLVKEEDEGPMVAEMARRSLIFKFANHYVAEHKNEAYMRTNDAVLKEFKAFLEKENFDYQEETESHLKELRSMAEHSHYSSAVLNDMNVLANALKEEKERGFERYKDHIAYEVDQELMARYHGERGRIEALLRGDRQLEVALGILKDGKVYHKELGD